ncbi:MAG: CorA family divalent cation transporter [bacterium]
MFYHSKKNLNKKKIELSNSVLLKKTFRFLKNREYKLGKLAEEYIIEKNQKLNQTEKIDGIIELYKFCLNNDTQENQKEISKIFEIKKIEDLDNFFNFFKSITYSKDCFYFINMDFPVKFIPLEFFNLLKIENLTIEDILSEDKYVKADFFNNYTYLSFIIPTDIKNLSLNSLSFEQINIIFKDNMLILIQEGIKGDIFDIIRVKLSKHDTILKKSLDYLLYYIIDVIIDKFLIILEKIEEEVYKIEESIFNNQFLSLSDNFVINKIYSLKRHIILIRNFSLKMLEIIKNLKNNYNDQNILNYYKDLIDHNYRLIEVTDNLEHLFSNILNLYISHLNYKQNDIMRILTIVNTIFVPIIFIASIYGMNFKYMPELEWKYGYYFTLFVMLIITIIVIIYFKKKKIL